MEIFNSFYLTRHKTQKLNWVYGLGNMEVQYLYLNKPYISVSTLIQFNILLQLEKHSDSKLSIKEISAKLAYDEKIIAIEANALVYHGSFNPRRNKASGLISHDRTDNKDLTVDDKIWLNKEFSANSLKLNTIPAVVKVIYIIN